MKGGKGRGQRVRNKSMVSPGVREREQQRLGRAERRQRAAGLRAPPSMVADSEAHRDRTGGVRPS